MSTEMVEHVEEVNGEIVDTDLTLDELEAQVEAAEAAGVAAFVAQGRALLTINRTGKYLAEYETFEEYVAHRWGMTRRNAYRYIDCAEIADECATLCHTVPASLRVALELVEVSERHSSRTAAEAWLEVEDQYQQQRDNDPKLRLTAKFTRRVLIDIGLLPPPGNAGESNRHIKAGELFERDKSTAKRLVRWVHDEWNGTPPGEKTRALAARAAALARAEAGVWEAIADGAEPDPTPITAAIEASQLALQGGTDRKDDQ